jgi:hypothetical protein
MFEFLGSSVVALLGGVLVAGLAAPFVYLRRRAQRADRSSLGARGSRSSARVVELWRDAEGLNVTYEFTPEGRTELVRRTETFEEVGPVGLAVGSVIEVAYESSPPFYSVAFEPVTSTRGSASSDA